MSCVPMVVFNVIDSSFEKRIGYEFTTVNNKPLPTLWVFNASYYGVAI